MKTIYLVRHCQAEGQPPEANLTEKGRKQAEALADFLEEHRIDCLIASPFERARQTVQPLADRLNITIQFDDRLRERVLSNRELPDWLKLLEESFTDIDLCLDGGESSRNATERGIEVVNEFLSSSYKSGVLVSHGNLIALILKHFDPDKGFEDWKALTNPDVFQLTFNDETAHPNCQRIWDERI
ncbi:histidine phosphatase family protein [Pullulanibacillus sp. KACC 23026]|uniref:histidine phosphatase family protein n=1 Tax=Pullulanibacillus sp. KACC 23026 TaxID=3028315 RepID=UPI0023B0C8D8|nr:histidine phosphatase family protein [Pullulanibacillus sp. KACC 23026]WEG12343.1 histidine phosphatase family protein [Pullulanibacillus sp. KACC 23026]